MSGGTKNDADKPPMAYVPSRAMFGIARAFGYGARKYGGWNYKQGLAATRLASATLRHLFAWLGGEDNDPESGTSHLHHAGASLCMLIDTVEGKPELDDRFKPQPPDAHGGYGG